MGRVKLNIGGVRFETSEPTLTKSSGFFRALLSENFKKEVDADGSVFIDRNGTHFAPILDYLRTGSFYKPKDLTLDTLFEESQFYGLDELAEFIANEQRQEETEMIQAVTKLKLENEGYYRIRDEAIANGLYGIAFNDDRRILIAINKHVDASLRALVKVCFF
jgi:hypothetical protein